MTIVIAEPICGQEGHVALDAVALPWSVSLRSRGSRLGVLIAGQLSAGRALRIAAPMEGTVGTGLIGLGLLQYGQLPPAPRLVCAIFGVVISTVALGGPGRIVATRLKLPEEILSTIRVQAVALSTTGLALLVGALVGSPTSVETALLAAGASLIAAAWAGFYTLSTRMPGTFYPVQGGTVRFSGAQGPFGYDVPDVEAALRKLVQG